MPRFASACLLLSTLTAGGIASAQGAAHAPAPSSSTTNVTTSTLDRRVDSLIAKLSLADKLELLGGEDGMYTRAIPAIGLRRLRMSDGPLGVGTWGPSTAYAAGVTLAATWDPALAQRVGASIGREARDRGVDIMLGPGVNIAREPMNGRNAEYFGEDPWLASRLAVGYINGIQSQGVVATVKHFAANNVETERHFVNVIADERTLHELYFPAFEAAVREAHVGAVMSSYNRVNGAYATQNAMLNLRVLKSEWAFDGLLMSDWGATYDAVRAANNGLDLEMPGARHMTPDSLRAAITRGVLTEATIDDKVRRLLRTAIRFGAFDRPAVTPVTVVEGTADSASARGVSLAVAREGIVLLKNDRSLLPLSPSTVHTIAVIGPNAATATVGNGGSAEITPFRTTNIVAGVADAAGSTVRVVYAPGLPDPVDIMRGTTYDPIDGHAGVSMERYNSPDFTGSPSATGRSRVVDLWSSNEHWSPRGRPTGIRWRARYTPTRTTSYLLLVAAGDNDSYTMYVDDRPVIVQPSHDGQAPASVTLPLEAGKTIELRMDYVQRGNYTRAGFGVIPTDSLISDEAKAIASHADAVVVSVGFSTTSESEGFDRTFGLPWGQDLLVQTLAAANKHTIVTLTSGGGVDLSPWIDRVPAVLHTWYLGQEGGTAVGEILFGARSPEGKLPVTIDRAWSDNPVHAHDMPVMDTVTTMPTLVYAESLSVGYRYYTTAHRTPLFAFGHGLSYTTFSIANLRVPKTVSARAGADVTVDVTNTGMRAGAEVVQLYVSDPSATVRRPERELKGFQKVFLAPGEHRQVTLHLNARSFAYYDVKTHAWRVDPGTFVIHVGNASDNTPLSASVHVNR